MCKPGWKHPHTEYCYKIFLEKSTNWHDARRICHTEGGFLVGIRNPEKQAHIEGMYLSKTAQAVVMYLKYLERFKYSYPWTH